MNLYNTTKLITEVEGEVEDFLFKCDTYTQLRSKHHFEIIRETSALFTEEYMNDLGNCLIEAFKMRGYLVKTFTGSREGEAVAR